MAESDYTHIRVSVKTRDRMRRIAERLVALAEKGMVDVPEINLEEINPNGCGLSMDSLINRLLDMLEGHRERAKRSRVNRLLRGEAGPAEAGGAGGDGQG